MSTVCQCNKEKKRNTHPRVREAFYNIAPLLSYSKRAEFSPPPLQRLICAGAFGVLGDSIWRFLHVQKSPNPDAVQGGGAWVSLRRTFPQTQELVFLPISPPVT
jgi:hypothetical protein